MAAGCDVLAWLRRVRAGRAERRRRARRWVACQPPVRWVVRRPVVRRARRLLAIRWVAELARAAVGVTIGLGLILIVLPLAVQNALIYFPSNTVRSAADVGLPDAERLTVPTTDALDLDAWYVPAAGETVGAVLVLHGNAGDRADRAPLAIALRDRGLASLLVDYRGFGGNPGTPSQQGLLDDAEAAAVVLERHSGLERDSLVYFGESLGAAPAAWLAARRPPAGLVLRSPFPSLTEVGRRRFPWLPVERLLRDHYPLASWIAGYEGPLLAIAGERDRLIPVSDSQRVVDAAGGGGRLLVVPGAGHNDLELLAGATMLDGITAFLRDEVGLPVRDAPAP